MFIHRILESKLKLIDKASHLTGLSSGSLCDSIAFCDPNLYIGQGLLDVTLSLRRDQ